MIHVNRRIAKNDRVLVKTGRNDRIAAVVTDVPENDDLIRIIDIFGKHEWWINRFQIVRIV